MILAYFLDASRESSSDFAPVTTILPDAKINAVVLGSRIRMITAANRCRGAKRRKRKADRRVSVTVKDDREAHKTMAGWKKWVALYLEEAGELVLYRALVW